MKQLLWAVALIAVFVSGCSCLQKPQAGLGVRRLDHVALHVKDLSRSAEFYRQTFGFEVVHQWKTTWMVGNDQIRLGLFQRPNANPVEDPDDKILIEHFAFLVKDQKEFDSVVKELDRLGVRHDEPEDTGIAKSVFFRDPDGHNLEVTFYYKEKPRI